MASRYVRQVTLYDALVGLTTEPYATVLRLIESGPGAIPYKLIAILIGSIFIPMLVFLAINPQLGGGDVVIGLLLSSAVILVLFVVLETVLLKVLGIDATIEDAFAVTSYATTPLILFVWLVYAFNLGTSGNITIFSAIFSGSTYYTDNFLTVIPYAFILIQINCALILYYSLKKLGDLHAISTIVTVLFSVVVGYISSTVGLLVGEVASPGLMGIVAQRLVPNSESLGTFLSHFISAY